MTIGPQLPPARATARVTAKGARPTVDASTTIDAAKTPSAPE
ncbi:hypothetical protein ACWDZ4_30675 [Streptomyces sp. NPDC003016]